jgi:hypothetical protein
MDAESYANHDAHGHAKQKGRAKHEGDRGDGDHDDLSAASILGSRPPFITIDATRRGAQTAANSSTSFVAHGTQ